MCDASGTTPRSGVPALARKPYAAANFVRGELVTPYKILHSARVLKVFGFRLRGLGILPEEEQMAGKMPIPRLIEQKLERYCD